MGQSMLDCPITINIGDEMRKKIVNILRTAIMLVETGNDLDFVLFFIKKAFKSYKVVS